ncbi:hypothetical protein [Dactylosporangium sp. NPDC051541]|uniref:hypothetical protein n=1 Tax=Dactylosporangium sp. NPDC051541 TaxID=3363977 RepID=UPI0037AB6F5D
MTEQPQQPLDHADTPGPDSAATQPLTSAAMAAARSRALTADIDDATQPLPPPPPREHPVHRPPTAMIAALAVGVLVAGAAVAILIGRIDRQPAAAADAAPQWFNSAQSLVDYLDRRGLPCTGYEAVDAVAAATVPGSVSRGRCTAGGSAVGVGVYSEHSDVEVQWSTQAGHGPLFMAIGQNWTVDGPADWTRRVAEVMSAQYRTQQ